MERVPRARQLWRSTRSSDSVSSQRNIVPVRTHSPEKPEPTCKAAPTGGALWPALARQVITPEVMTPELIRPASFPVKAIAAPEARSRDCDREDIRERTAFKSDPRDSASRCTADAAVSVSVYFGRTTAGSAVAHGTGSEPTPFSPPPTASTPTPSPQATPP